jgi:hypothetical protein
MAAKTFYVWTTGADTNSGSSEATTPIANGTAATRSGAVYTLDGTPDLSGVTANQDTIHIVGETSGRGNDGTIFEITAVDDGVDTVTVDPTPTGGTSGLTWAIGGAFATIDKSMNVVADKDTVYVKATATYDENADVVTAGSLTGGITYEGYTTTPGDNGKPVWKNSSGNALTDTVTFGYYIFKNFDFDGSSSIGVNIGSAYKFINCDFQNNGGTGCIGSSYINFIRCTSKSNSGNGFQPTGSGCKVVGCVIGDNTFRGINFNSSIASIVYKTVIYGGNSGGSGEGILNCGDWMSIIGCTIDGDGTSSDLISFATNEYPKLICDNILYDGGWGIDMMSTVGGEEWAAFVGYNLVNSNSNGDYTYSTDANPIVGFGDVTSAPSFTDEANDDYTLATGSAAIDSGISPGGIT